MITLGPHRIGPASDHSKEWARHAGIVKQVDATDLLAAAPDNCVRIFRHYFERQDLEADPLDVANAILHGLGGYRHPLLYVEILNEIGEGGLTAYIRLIKGVVPILHAADVKVCGPSWGTGDYTLAAWQAFRAVGWCGLDAIALHCYWGNLGLTIWHALRYRQYWQAGDPRVFVTECGRDAIEGGGRGWRVCDITPAQYVAELVAFSREIARDGVLAVVFQEGASDEQWAAFDTEALALESLYSAGGSAGGGPLPIPASGRLWLAIVPSNQDRNPVVGGGTEMSQMVAFATALEREAKAYAPITVKVFAGKPESQDKTPYAGLHTQTDAAKAWLGSAPAGTYTVALNLHTDSGEFSHVGYYYAGGTSTVSYRLGRRIAWQIDQFFGANTPIWNQDYSGYIFAEAASVAAAVLMELGSHQWASDVNVLRVKGQAIARAIVEAILTELGLPLVRVVTPPGPTLNTGELRTFPVWATERLAAGEDFRGTAGLADFKRHLTGIGADAKTPARYGWPA